jgi:hypothetical protein
MHGPLDARATSRAELVGTRPNDSPTQSTFVSFLQEMEEPKLSRASATSQS